MFDQVLTTGEATYLEDALLLLHRHGYTEECYFNYTFTAIRGEGGEVEGVFNAVVETTFRVISERRTALLREIGERIGGVRSAAEAWSTATGSSRGTDSTRRSVSSICSTSQDTPRTSRRRRG